MILLVSGEGPTDVGVCRNGSEECEGRDFEAGPMAALIDQIVAVEWGYSPLESSAIVFISEAGLAAKSRMVRATPKALVLPGRKGAKETAYFFRNAQALAREAKDRTTSDSPVGAVLFRDTDGTNSAPRRLWDDKLDSMRRGFAAEGFDFGVPMVPRPKSEAWLLCALQEVPYQNCARYEELPGNDGSPNSAKHRLAMTLERLDCEPEDLLAMIAAGKIDAERIEMESFTAFRSRLLDVARRLKES